MSLKIFAQEVEVELTSIVKNINFDFGIGSKVELAIKSKNEKAPAVFLGRLVDQSNTTLKFLFLNEKKTRISMIDSANITGFRKSRSQAIISPVDQMGSTCSAYGFFHFWNQMHVAGFSGLAEMGSIMSSERKRLQFLEEAIDLYYIQNKINITTLMKNYGKRFGFRCTNNHFTDPKKAVDFIYEKASEGRPILIDFNIGSDMVASSYELIDFENPVTLDMRLWIPRKIGERAKDGHIIVAAAAFLANGRKKVLILDSNWAEPRVWDLDRYLGKKVAVKEMGFHTCN